MLVYFYDERVNCIGVLPDYLTSNCIFMWEEKENSLYRKFEFKNFNEAFGFMARVSLIAEKMDHHPKWTNVWNTVEIWLSTHSAGDVVTEKDKKLASAIDAL
jgi:4a-hydroxytetrahydrobiopterin dehydratase